MALKYFYGAFIELSWSLSVPDHDELSFYGGEKILFFLLLLLFMEKNNDILIGMT